MPSIAMASNDPKEKKEKRMKKKKKEEEEVALVVEEETVSSIKKEKKKKQKRKAAEMEEEEEERSDTSSEFGEPANLKSSSEAAELKKEATKKAKVELEERAKADVEEKRKDTKPVTGFRISEPLREKLKAREIETLYPIQWKTFDLVLDGLDLVGRARTGQGKTLAFVLPILESLTNGPAKGSRKTGYGRPPSVLVLLPTRELASQVCKDFEVYGGSLGLSALPVYGGSSHDGASSYNVQQNQLKRGVDIVVGTPGRVKDLIEKGSLDLSSLKFRVLDEADEMLRMGFVDDVELILGKVSDVSKVQTLLFSATMPDWVKKLSLKFLKSTKETVDLVGNEKMKASISVRHIAMVCSASAISHVIPDIICCYGSGGRTIIFTEKKESANELSALLPGARPLHGDISQSQREVTLSGFRAGKFMTLVATDVAARGLDINDVQLVIQCEPPREVEAYIHRSGRTGRAGHTGVSVMLYDSRRKSDVSRIQKASGFIFEDLSAPKASDIAKAAGEEAAQAIVNVSDSVVSAFKSAAEDLLSTSGFSAVELLAKALAKTSGYSDIKSRSLLTSMEGHVAVILEAGRPFFSHSHAYGVLRRFLPEEKVESVKGMTLTADGRGAVFDVAAEDLDTFLTGQENAANISLEVLKALPPLQERDQSRGRFGAGGRGRGGFGGSRSSGSFSGGRGGRSGRYGSSDRSGGRFSGGGFKGRGNKW